MYLYFLYSIKVGQMWLDRYQVLSLGLGRPFFLTKFQPTASNYIGLAMDFE